MSDDYIVGIDNGLKGGIVILKDGLIAAHHGMPLSPCCKRIDAAGVSWIFKCCPGTATVAIEAAPDHMSSYKAAKSILINYGIIRAAAEIAKLRVVDIPYGNRLDSWQRAILGCVPKGKTKKVAEEKAREIWPGVRWPTLHPNGRKPHDGIIDAALIAHHARNLDLNRK